MQQQRQIEAISQGWAGRFSAMASPCELLCRSDSQDEARRLLDLVADEAARIETKFSRYRDDNVMHRINASQGEWVAVDEETSRLLDYADTCFQLSGGRFDVTSGVLRKAWTFDCSDRLPDAETVQALLADVGWSRVERRPGAVRLAPGMELDFGGIGKEYAVDRALGLAAAMTGADLLVNFGGDLAARGGQPWQVGLESAGANGVQGQFSLTRGALATSGDSRRYLLRDGVRYSHVLDPTSGWPVTGGPHSVTVAASHCTQAGMLATLALLQGAGAEDFLRQQGVRYWCQWE